MMHESQRYAAIIIDKILGGTNLDIAFENVFRNVKRLEHKSQTKAITYGALRYMGQSKYLIKSLVRKKTPMSTNPKNVSKNIKKYELFLK